MRYINRHLAVTTGILVALAGTAVPARAVTPISKCDPSSPPPAGSLISAPGNYVLTANLTCTGLGDGDAIDISASNVTVKLNGHIITGPGALNATGISIDFSFFAPRVNHVGISGPGVVQGFGTGVSVQHADYSQVTQTTIVGNQVGIAVSDATYTTLAGNTVGRNSVGGAGVGLDLYLSTGAQVTDNQFVANGLGIYAESGDSNMVTGNVISGNLGAGIQLGTGVPLTNSRFSGNTTNVNGVWGIFVQQLEPGNFGNEFFNNTSIGNGKYDLEDDNPPSCGTVYWSNDVFFTTNNPSCVR